MRIGLIQCNPVAGALGRNCDLLYAGAVEAASHGAELCVAPELALCGVNVGDLLLLPSFMEECREALAGLAERFKANPSLPPLLLGAPVYNPVPQGKPLQNCAVLLRNGEVTVISRKVLLPSANTRDDRRYFEPGMACGVLQHKGWRIAVTIGEDVWNDRTFWQDRRTFDSDPVAEFMSAVGADGLVNLTSLSYAQGLPALHQRMLGWMAVHYRVPVMAANLVGGNDGEVHYGGSLAFDGEGTLVARAPLFKEGVLMADMVGKKVSSIAPGISAWEELWQALVLGTRDYICKCGMDSVVLGLSGGIDSALAAAIAVEALGADKVSALLMPSEFSSPGSITDSMELARSLDIRDVHTIPITPAFTAFKEILSGVFAGRGEDVTEENIQSRVRGVLLMAYANKFNKLLLATSNKSELAVGYCTLYGDSCGALEPIGDVYKTQVYGLCRWLNKKRAGTIPGNILNKEPSAELAHNQKDTDSLPPYADLDRVLYELVENGQGEQELVEKGYDEALVRKISGLLKRSEFKRKQGAPVLQVSTRSFGTGWRMPINRVAPGGQ